MSHTAPKSPAHACSPLIASLTTPTGLQANATLFGRRAAVLTLAVASWLGLLAWAVSILSVGGWSLAKLVMLTCFAFALPWPVLGLWNACLGLWLLHGVRDPLALAAPFWRAGTAPTPLFVRTAVLMTVRNEDPERAMLRLKTIKASIEATGEGRRFSYFLLSDTDVPAIAAAEEQAVGAWCAGDPNGLIYRRRSSNEGFKAGNLRDFCIRFGAAFDLMLPLDADSLMTGEAIVRLVRIMQAHPKLGILQSLVVGLPSGSPFARIFQFGMRLGMRTYTMGQAWWAGDCGPFWGHNGLVRIKPYVDNCVLPVLPGGGPLGGRVLSHDQLEAALMRRAGYEVRVMPVEGGSYEDNPPNVLAFIQRDVRWCQGNMQYVRLLTLPGLKPMSRFQLLWAILMFAGIPAWTIMIALLPFVAGAEQGLGDFPTGSAIALYAVVLLMSFAPKIAGVLDVALTPGEVARFGGGGRFVSSALIEVIFSFLLGAISTIRTTLFLAGLLFGKSIGWKAQARDVRGLPWGTAARGLWPQTLFGMVVCGALFFISPSVLLWSLPLTAGYLLSIPFAVMTASPELGRVMRRHGFAGIAEEFEMREEIAAVT